MPCAFTATRTRTRARRTAVRSGRPAGPPRRRRTTRASTRQNAGALTLEEDECLSLDVRCVGDSEFAVQCGLSGDVLVGYQHADDHFVRGVFQAVDVDARVGQRVAPGNTNKSIRCRFALLPTSNEISRNTQMACVVKSKTNIFCSASRYVALFNDTTLSRHNTFYEKYYVYNRSQ